MEELWEKIIINKQETFYSVSNWGRIKNDSTGTILQGTINNNGYRMVHLRYRIDKYCSVHRLVMKAFKPCAEMDDLQVNHIDGDKLNNNLNNLEWSTALENMRHSFKNGLQKYDMLECHVYDLEGKYLKSYENCCEASKELGIHQSNINRCLKGIYTHINQYQFRKFKKDKIDPWDKPNTNIVYVYNDKGEFLDSYKSQHTCALAFGVSDSSICRYLNPNNNRKLEGFVFSKKPL